VRGQPAAPPFEVVYAEHARFIAGIVQRMVGRTHGEVDDLVQETFIDAVDGLAKIRNPEDPSIVRAWLVTVAVRRARRFLGRAKRRALFALFAKDYAPRASDPRDRAPVDDLYEALDQLPADLRIAWSLHRIEQWSLPQTAAVCEVSLATIKRRIAEAEERLERRLAEEKPHNKKNEKDEKNAKTQKNEKTKEGSS
jgi:RNA polymerase sigma-70 factor (ECF subfamily)